MKIKIGDRAYYMTRPSAPLPTVLILDEYTIELAEAYQRILLKEIAADSKLLKELLTKD